MSNRLNNIRGFSLIELAIVVMVIGITIGAGLTVLSQYSSQSKITQTKLRIEAILDVINEYADEYNSLPCPASYTAPFGSNAHGLADCGAAYSGGGTVMGAVPTTNLGLYPTMSMDGWGRRMTYIVKSAATTPSTGLDTAVGSLELDLKDYTGATDYSEVVVIVMSHGENGYGAYNGRGSSRVATTNAIQQEINNTDPDLQFNSSVSVAGFDDIVYFWTLDQITDDSME